MIFITTSPFSLSYSEQNTLRRLVDGPLVPSVMSLFLRDLFVSSYPCLYIKLCPPLPFVLSSFTVQLSNKTSHKSSPHHSSFRLHTRFDPVWNFDTLGRYVNVLNLLITWSFQMTKDNIRVYAFLIFCTWNRYTFPLLSYSVPSFVLLITGFPVSL